MAWSSGREASFLQRPLPLGFGWVNGIAEQDAESPFVFLVFREVWNGCAHRLGPRLEALAEFAVCHDVQLIIQNSLQHAFANFFFRPVEMEEIAALLPAPVGLGLAGVRELGGACPGRVGDIRLYGPRAERRADDSLRLELSAHAFDHMHGRAFGSAVNRGSRMWHEA